MEIRSFQRVYRKNERLQTEAILKWKATNALCADCPGIIHQGDSQFGNTHQIRPVRKQQVGKHDIIFFFFYWGKFYISCWQLQN